MLPPARVYKIKSSYFQIGETRRESGTVAHLKPTALYTYTAPCYLICSAIISLKVAAVGLPCSSDGVLLQGFKIGQWMSQQPSELIFLGNFSSGVCVCVTHCVCRHERPGKSILRALSRDAKGQHIFATVLDALAVRARLSQPLPCHHVSQARNGFR